MNAIPETIFSKIIRKEIPAKIAFESERILAFHDINPQAPIHILIIPKKPIVNCNGAEMGDAALLGELFVVAGQLAQQQGLADKGYRLVMNNGAEAGQTVFHMHLHLLGGRPFAWPPG